MSAAILVKPYDVIYVPKTYVRDLRVFMEQYFATIAEVASFVNTLADINQN
jgi:polysaccharide export outer membrane protein